MKTFAHLGVFPAYRDNPFLNLMLLAPRAAGWDVVEMTKLEALEAQLARFVDGDVFHMHWTSPIVQREDDEAEARARFDRFRVALDGARERGVKVVWTIHNVLPHDARHIDLEVELNRYLAAAADRIHLMNRATSEVVAEFYTLDAAKIVHIPHPSYQGVYSSSLTRADARASFHVTDDDFAILFFGQMRPYKGLDVLIEAVGLLDPSLHPVLLLAGRATEEERRTVEALIPTHVRTATNFDYVEDSEIERWFRASDVAAFPYRQVLNSGSLHLAATYGCTVILPDEQHTRDEFADERWLQFFDPAGRAPALAGRLHEVAALDAPGIEASGFARRNPPFAFSRRYSAVLKELVGRSELE